MTGQGHAVTSAPTMSGRLCRWRRKRVPVWRVKRDHVGGYAMDSVHITPAPGFFVGCPAATLVALRQPAIFHAAAEVFSSSSKCSRESSEIFFVFSQPAAARFMSARRVRDYLFCNQLTPLCGISAWVHPPLSSVSALAPMAPPKWSHRPPPLTTSFWLAPQ